MNHVLPEALDSQIYLATSKVWWTWTRSQGAMVTFFRLQSSLFSVTSRRQVLLGKHNRRQHTLSITRGEKAFVTSWSTMACMRPHGRVNVQASVCGVSFYTQGEKERRKICEGEIKGQDRAEESLIRLPSLFKGLPQAAWKGSGRWQKRQVKGQPVAWPMSGERRLLAIVIA